MRFSLNFVKEFIKIDLPAERLASVLTTAGIEVERYGQEGADYSFDIEITSNRYDWLSILGIAREFSACLDKKITLKYPKVNKSPIFKNKLIKIENQKDCLFYAARRINNVNISASPTWLKERVMNCGINSINNAVDVTNYCMLKWGNPLHAFDEDKIEGDIYIRRAKDGEKFIGIDEKEYILNKENLVIADSKKVIALAGVMGAKNTEVTEKTKNILLEAAIFSPLAVRHSRRSVGIDTDSSYRFERQVFADYLEYASQEAADLIAQLSNGSFLGYAQAGKKPVYKNKKILIELDKMNEYLGVNIPKTKVKNILYGLGFEVKEQRKDVLAVFAPKQRFDIAREVDVYEEISRIYGYDKIALQLPAVAHEVVKSEAYEVKKELRLFLARIGLSEVITYSIESDEDFRKFGFDKIIRLVNTLRSQENALRPTLLLGMIKTIAYNLNRSRTDLKFFEIANTYLKSEKSFLESPFLSIGVSAEDKDCFDLKGVIEAILRFLNIRNYTFKEESSFCCANALKLYISGVYAGFLGKLDEKIKRDFGIKKNVLLAELDVAILLNNKEEKIYSPISAYPVAWRDISIALHESKKFRDIEKIIGEKQEYICDYRIVDIYKGKDLEQGYKAFSLRIFYQSIQRTLTSQEVDEAHNAIRGLLEQQDGVRLR